MEACPTKRLGRGLFEGRRAYSKPRAHSRTYSTANRKFHSFRVAILALFDSNFSILAFFNQSRLEYLGLAFFLNLGYFWLSIR